MKRVNVTLPDDVMRFVSAYRKAKNAPCPACGHKLERWTLSGFFEAKLRELQDTTEILPDGTMYDEGGQS